MGRPKPLLPFADRTAIELLVGHLHQAGIAPIVVVLGPGGEAVADRLADSPVILTWNRTADSDMATSLRVGAACLTPPCSAVLVALADHPLVSPATLGQLCAGHGESPDTILVPTWDGRGGHPVLLPRDVLGELDLLPTLREVVHRDPGRIRRVPVADPGILYDLDTPEDYRQALAYYAGGGSVPGGGSSEQL